MKYINREVPVRLKTLIVSGDLTENSIVQIFDDGKLVARGRWYNDNILDYAYSWGIASKVGTGLTLKFNLR